MAHKKQADYQWAKQMLFGVVDRKGLIEVQRVLKKAGDQMSVDLLRDVQIKLIDKLDLDRGADEAISRLSQLGSRGKSWDPALIRNNVFKAAHSLGMKLPSAMFASEDTGLRKAIVRLAQQNPGGIRRHLVPLLREAADKAKKERERLPKYGEVHKESVAGGAAYILILGISQAHKGDSYHLNVKSSGSNKTLYKDDFYIENQGPGQGGAKNAMKRAIKDGRDWVKSPAGKKKIERAAKK